MIRGLELEDDYIEELWRDTALPEVQMVPYPYRDSLGQKEIQDIFSHSILVNWILIPIYTLNSLRAQKNNQH